MTELQQARADWLDALSKNVELECQVERLKQANFELQSQLINAQAMACIHEMNSSVMIHAMFSWV
jgi:hypothetical protein